ncbi:MAG: hypothetical protein IJ829_00445, partial [Kiritimatiellae bacterium]|nr:hypothetical protein [Kiritimatiellia bacterium]
QTADFIDPLVAVSEKASYPAVTDKIVKDRPIPLPPLSVQRSIVARLEAAREMCDRLKAAAERGLRAAENLRKAILKEAFTQ